MNNNEHQDIQNRGRETKAAFTELIRGFCNLHRLDDAGGVVAGKPIEIDGVSFSLLYDEQTQPGVLFIYTGYGSVTNELARDAYASLLEVNLFLHRVGGGTLAIAPGRNEVVLAESFPLAGLSPELLGDLLKHGAQNALNWRTTYFLEKDKARQQARMRTDIGAAMRQRLFGKGNQQ
jgi:hypothetical protein